MEDRLMQITDAHVEWAVVHRWREILRDGPDSEFDVTLTYAVFSALLCWTVQRMRSPRDSYEARIAAKAWDDLERKKFTDLLAGLGDDITSNVPPELRLLSASKGLVWLRHVVAHGDARRVTPLNGTPNTRGIVQLLGFRLKGLEPACEFDMDRATMAAVGIALANQFCRAFGQDDGPDAYFAQEARRGVALSSMMAVGQ